MDIELQHGDITQLAVDGIVNAANSSLMGGGGVDGAIHRAGGSQILEACKIIRKRQGKCPPGEAVITNAGKLPCQKVIHTVGPVWHKGNRKEKELLKNCYNNSLALAEKHELKTLAFPNISTGAYHFPKKEAAEIALKTVQNHQAKTLQKIIFCCFDAENYALYSDILNS